MGKVKTEEEMYRIPLKKLILKNTHSPSPTLQRYVYLSQE